MPYGKLVFTPQEWQEAAHKYRKELLMLPLLGCNDTLQHMTGRPGIRYKESVGTIGLDAQFAPYKVDRRSNADLNLSFRTLETFFGNVVKDFEPNSAIRTLLGTGATKGNAQASTPTARQVLALIAKSLSHHLNESIWSAVRNENGDTTAELFNGFDTITQTEITAGNLSAANNNYVKLTDDITTENAVDIAKDILFHLDPHLRSQQLLMYCSQDFYDKYSEAYQKTHGGLIYNTQYLQDTVEGSQGRLKLVPLANKADSKFIHIAPKSNMLYGYDNMSDVESIEVERFAPFVLTYVATMFFGVQFESLDKSRLKVVELKSASTAQAAPTQTTGGTTADPVTEDENNG